MLFLRRSKRGRWSSEGIVVSATSRAKENDVRELVSANSVQHNGFAASTEEVAITIALCNGQYGRFNDTSGVGVRLAYYRQGNSVLHLQSFAAASAFCRDRKTKRERYLIDMVKQLKAFAGSGIALLLGWGVPMIWPNTPSLGWFFIGIATFWFVVALFRNKRLIRRFPGIVDWMPFLEEDSVSLPRELTAKFIQGHTIKITDLAVGSKIMDRSFDDCVFLGPAVCAPMGTTVMHNIGFAVDALESCFTEVEAGRRIVGVVGLENCVFKHCRFVDVMFIGTKADAGRFRAGFRQPLSAPDTGASPPSPTS